MKSCRWFGLSLVSALLAGCSSAPVRLAAIGPSPGAVQSPSRTGQLEVYSAVEECHDGNEYDTNPAWYQHTDYLLYHLNGRRIRHVSNSVGHYAQRPCAISLAPGNYLVKARAKDYLSVLVPVEIKAGCTTRVHLDDAWKPVTSTHGSELVNAPSGYPVGWSVGLTKTGR